jgi:hypothetical protein
LSQADETVWLLTVGVLYPKSFSLAGQRGIKGVLVHPLGFH